MKKIISLITAAAAVFSAVPMAAHAEEKYCPTVYFKAEAKDPAFSLPSGTLYVNTEKISGDKVSLPTQVLIKDTTKTVGQFLLKWKWDTDYVYTSGIRNPSADGKTPAYKGYEITTNNKGEKQDPIMYRNVEGEKVMGITYSDMGSEALEITGAESDSNPVGLMELNIAKNSPADRYSIDFITDYPLITNIILRVANQPISSTYPSGATAPSLKVAASDRDLGDVNKDGITDGRDATSILSDYAARSVGKDSIFDKAQSIAADVDGNEIVDAIDATSVLGYYAFISTDAGKGKSFGEFLNK